MTKTMQKVTAVEDGDGHWYVIPSDMYNKFIELLHRPEDESEFLEKFDQFRTGGDLNNIQLYAEI